MMCERALSRESHGKVIAEHQMVQDKIAESYVKLKMLRLYVLETAWKIDNTSTQEARTDIAAIKFTMARVLRRDQLRRAARPRRTRHDRPDPAAGDVRRRAHHGPRRRPGRSAHRHRGPQRA